jgi:hypothetical protein
MGYPTEVLLADQFPVGSQWEIHTTWLDKPEHRVYRVVGYDGDGIVAATTTNGGNRGYALLSPKGFDDLTRVPDPPPCPITEPVTLWSYRPGVGAHREWTTSSNVAAVARIDNQTAITLHPPGTPVDSHEWGVYTWDKK